MLIFLLSWKKLMTIPKKRNELNAFFHVFRSVSFIRVFAVGILADWQAVITSNPLVHI